LAGRGDGQSLLDFWEEGQWQWETGRVRFDGTRKSVYGELSYRIIEAWRN